ncbi:hypothetical protein RE6C_02844 [Rhodopirellula europaea 6C]|uniref:Uncharacterized protein n=1 Tax=Rhodopirellula europaea 6C TaxID=1263867 RepID=M2B2R8_9BACT|nr:hypothetical protein RE6C_02844 [Rhodopirellula europaea 6C]
MVFLNLYLPRDPSQAIDLQVKQSVTVPHRPEAMRYDKPWLMMPECRVIATGQPV